MTIFNPSTMIYILTYASTTYNLSNVGFFGYFRVNFLEVIKSLFVYFSSQPLSGPYNYK